MLYFHEIRSDFKKLLKQNRLSMADMGNLFSRALGGSIVVYFHYRSFVDFQMMALVRGRCYSKADGPGPQKTWAY